MNPNEITELLDRAASSVTPAGSDPVTTMVRLGRRSANRRRAWAAAVATGVVALAVPLALGFPGDAKPTPSTTVAFGGLTITVPDGWKTTKAARFDPCTAKPDTIYFVDTVEPSHACAPSDQAWIAVQPEGTGGLLSPPVLVSKDANVLEGEDTMNGLWRYRAFGGAGTTAGLVLPDLPEKRRSELLELTTWPAGPAAPPGGGLTLPKTITSVSIDAPGVPTATDAKTLNRIREQLAGLTEPVPAGEECVLKSPGSVGLGFNDGIIVVLGDATCPQAVSDHGGRVRVPASLGKELFDEVLKNNSPAGG